MSLLPYRALIMLAQQLSGSDRNVEFLGEGDFFRAYAIAGRWVTRVARHAEAAAALRREACLLPLLAERLPLRIPRPLMHYGGAPDDPPFLIHAMVPGCAFTSAAYEALPVASRERCARTVGEFLASLHRTNLSIARDCGVQRHDFTASTIAAVREANIAVDPWVLGLLEAHQYCRFQPVLLHGDLSPDHVLWDEDTREVTGIIDFGDVAIGDPAWDFVYLYEDYGEDFVNRAMNAYPTDDREALLRRVRGLQVLEAICWSLRSAIASVESAAFIAGIGALAMGSPLVPSTSQAKDE